MYFEKLTYIYYGRQVLEKRICHQFRYIKYIYQFLKVACTCNLFTVAIWRVTSWGWGCEWSGGMQDLHGIWPWVSPATINVAGTELNLYIMDMTCIDCTMLINTTKWGEGSGHPRVKWNVIPHSSTALINFKSIW